MRALSLLNKPEYWFQPRQLLRKIQFILSGGSANALARVQLPWGAELEVNSDDSIGKSLLTYGVYELGVSEVLWRLIDPGDWCLDLGANIGCLTSLLMARSGESGRVYGFEPHPIVFQRLATNLGEAFGGEKHAPVTLIQHAIGDHNGEVDLMEPEGFNQNEGRASIADASREPTTHSTKHRVRLQRLDSVFHGVEQFGVMKIDVEGSELAALRGAERLLAGRKIRDIVFEDFQPFPSDCVTLLQRHGYRIYRLAKAILGPVVWEPSDPQTIDRALPWETVNYLATLDPVRAENRLRPRGWFCLKRRN